MKSIVSEKPCEQKIEYPCLMQAGSGNIYKMLSSNKGFLVHKEEDCFGCPMIDSHNGFILFHGSVCLEN